MKKIFCIFLAVCLSVLVFTGCSEDTEMEINEADSENNDIVNESETNNSNDVYALTLEEKQNLRADEILSTMTVEEVIAQLFLVRCDKSVAEKYAKEYSPGGYILFARDFKDETPETIRDYFDRWQNAADTGMILAVDEEGGTVVRVSQYRAFRSEKFKSPQVLYKEGGFKKIAYDAAEKSDFLLDLGLNMNLAPVCDISENSNDFIYNRAFGKGAQETSEYVSVVVSEMSKANIASVLKHFPGYGGNVDTHTGIAVDERPYEQFENSDFLPFKAGIEAGADCVLVSHNTVKCMDAELPASLSKKVHDILREELSFDGVIMTDDLVMDAIGEIASPSEAAVIAVNAGNDMLISSDFLTQYNAVLSAYNDGVISKERLYDAAKHVILLKLKRGIIID